MRVLYEKISAALQFIPKDAAYRQYTEQILKDKMTLVSQVWFLSSISWYSNSIAFIVEFSSDQLN